MDNDGTIFRVSPSLMVDDETVSTPAEPQTKPDSPMSPVKPEADIPARGRDSSKRPTKRKTRTTRKRNIITVARKRKAATFGKRKNQVTKRAYRRKTTVAKSKNCCYRHRREEKKKNKVGEPGGNDQDGNEGGSANQPQRSFQDE